MQGDMHDGGLTAADLARLEAEGAIEIHQPGTPGYAEHARAMREQVAAADAEELAVHGPDAVTSVRLLRQAAVAAERDPERIGSAFAAWCAVRGWDRRDLADHLGVSVDRLAALALESRAIYVRALAERYRVDAGRLAAVLNGGTHGD